MSTDPRLTNVTLLTLAAFRVRERCQSGRGAAWEHTAGLSALLDAARQQALPQRAPWSLPDLDPCDGLARLLAEARQRQKGGDDGA
jgi:hypothetical protein